MKMNVHRGEMWCGSGIGSSSFAMNAGGLDPYYSVFSSASHAPLRETHPSYDDIAKMFSHGGTETQRNTFVHDGLDVMREKLFTSNFSFSTFFTWGTDLSGTLQGAGGVGGLLAVMVDGATPTTYYPCYDANGQQKSAKGKALPQPDRDFEACARLNEHKSEERYPAKERQQFITAYVDELGDVRAEYSYDAFGQTISQGGDMASTFSHRFSTKYADDETGLYYYGYRYYAPGLGRWMSRDPIEEEGGVNLYGFIQNDGINMTDYLGKFAIAPANDSPSGKIADEINKTIWAGVFIILSANDLERMPNGGMLVHGKRVTINLRDKDGKSVVNDTQAVTQRISIDSKGMGRRGKTENGRNWPPNQPSNQDFLLEAMPLYNVLLFRKMENCVEGEITIKANWYLFDSKNKYGGDTWNLGVDVLSGSNDYEPSHGSIGSEPGYPRVKKSYFAAGSYYVKIKISKSRPYFETTLHYANPLWKSDAGWPLNRERDPEGKSDREYPDNPTKWYTK